MSNVESVMERRPVKTHVVVIVLELSLLLLSSSPLTLLVLSLLSQLSSSLLIFIV